MLFITSPLTFRETPKALSRTRQKICVMKISSNPLPPILTGSITLAATLTNRLAFTPDLALPQSRSDILSLVASATLILHGLTLTQIADTKVSVPLTGTRLTYAPPTLNPQVKENLLWITSALLTAIPTVQTVQIVRKGGEILVRQGLFRDGLQDNGQKGYGGKVVDNIASGGERLYVADTKVYPGWQDEFPWLPIGTQAIMVTGGHGIALCLGADKPRPFVGRDFGWIQAMEDRIKQDVGERNGT